MPNENCGTWEEINKDEDLLNIIRSMEEYAELARKEEQEKTKEMKEVIDGLIGIIENPNSDDLFNLMHFTGLAVIAKEKFNPSLKLDKEGDGNE